MAKPTTVKDFTQKKREIAANRLASAKAAVASAAADVTAVLGRHETSVAEALLLSDEQKELRKQLQLVATPAEGHVLLTKLRTNIIASRAKHYELLQAGEELAIAQKATERAGSQIGSATAALARASAELESTSGEDHQRTSLKDRLGQPPLDTLKSDAMAAIDSQDARFKAAKQRVESDLPAGIRNRARERNSATLSRFSDRKDGAEDAITALENKWEDSNKVAKQQSILSRAHERLRWYVEAGPDRYASAIAIMEAIPGAPAQTSDVSQAIKPGKFPNSADALSLEQARDAARKECEIAEKALRAVELQELVKDPFQVLSSNGEVIDSQNALDAKLAALLVAEQAYTKPMRELLDSWEAAIPDSSWALLADFERAVATLNELSAIDPEVLVQELGDAEAALAEALDRELISQSVVEVLGEKSIERSDAVAVLVPTAPARSLAALRGDA